MTPTPSETLDDLIRVASSALFKSPQDQAWAGVDRLHLLADGMLRFVVDDSRLCWGDVAPPDQEKYRDKYRPLVERWRELQAAGRLGEPVADVVGTLDAACKLGLASRKERRAHFPKPRGYKPRRYPRLR